MATSITRSEPSGAIKAFATLRFAGDRLDPDQISQILNIQPTKASRRSDKRTGIWYLATDKLIPGNDLARHIEFLLALLLPSPGNVERLATICDVVKKRGLEAHVTAFWHGKSGARKPNIPEIIQQVFGLIPADLETDFATEEPAKPAEKKRSPDWLPG